MYVIKRNGRKEQVMFDKITSRINKLSYGLDPNYVQPFKIAQKVMCFELHAQVHTHHLLTAP